MIVFYMIATTFYAILIFGYLADPNTHYTSYSSDLWWGLFCFFFPQMVSWIGPFDIFGLIGETIMAVYGLWLIFFYYTSILDFSINNQEKR